MLLITHRLVSPGQIDQVVSMEDGEHPIMAELLALATR